MRARFRAFLCVFVRFCVFSCVFVRFRAFLCAFVRFRTVQYKLNKISTFYTLTPKITHLGLFSNCMVRCSRMGGDGLARTGMAEHK